MALLFIILQLCFGVFFLFLAIAFFAGAPFVPSTSPVASVMLDFAGLKPGEKAYDLGSGNGKLILMAGHLGARATGIEINPILVFLTRIRIALSPDRSNLAVRMGDFWHTDLSDADAVFVYLLPWKMGRLKTKLLRELRPGTRVISNSFLFPEWKPVRSDTAAQVFAYRIPRQIRV